MDSIFRYGEVEELNGGFRVVVNTRVPNVSNFNSWYLANKSPNSRVTMGDKPLYTTNIYRKNVKTNSDINNILHESRGVLRSETGDPYKGGRTYGNNNK